MGREVRRVPKDWQHPRYTAENAPYSSHIGRYKPLFEGRDLTAEIAEWDEAAKQWDRGFVRDYTKAGVAWKPRGDESSETYSEYAGSRPDYADHMPNWPASERTHLMMYEDTSEGTPISPAFETPEELARWLTDNGASAFGDMKGSYEGWLKVCRGRASVGMIVDMDRGTMTPDMEAC